MDRTRVIIAVLAAVVVALVVVLIVVASGDDESDRSPTAPVTATRTVTTTEPASPQTTTTSSGEATISQGQAKDAARAGASAAAQRGGVSIPPGEWDARCTAVGGADQAAVWRCQAVSTSGQCAGSITAYAAAPGRAATRDARIGCRE